MKTTEQNNQLWTTHVPRKSFRFGPPRDRYLDLLAVHEMEAWPDLNQADEHSHFYS